MKTLGLLSVFLAVVAPAHVEASDTLAVGLVGLGQMGQSIAKCYDRRKVQVHAWNRGEQRRQQVRNMDLKHVHVSDTLEVVLASADLILMAVVGGEDLQNAEALIKSVPAVLWNNKTLVQYSAHETLSAKKHKHFLDSLGAHLIAGAMLAQPEKVCGHIGLFLIATEHASVLQSAAPILEMMGPLVSFEDDVGLALLADIGVLESVYFGITGFEMTYLMLERYGAPPNFGQRLVELCSKMMQLWFRDISQMAHHVMRTKHCRQRSHGERRFSRALAVFGKVGPRDGHQPALVADQRGGHFETQAASRWIEFVVTDPGGATAQSAEL